MKACNLCWSTPRAIAHLLVCPEDLHCVAEVRICHNHIPYVPSPNVGFKLFVVRLSLNRSHVSSLSGNVLIFQACVMGNRKKVFGLRKCVYGTRPVSAHPLSAI